MREFLLRVVRLVAPIGFGFLLYWVLGPETFWQRVFAICVSFSAFIGMAVFLMKFFEELRKLKGGSR